MFERLAQFVVRNAVAVFVAWIVAVVVVRLAAPSWQSIAPRRGFRLFAGRLSQRNR